MTIEVANNDTESVLQEEASQVSDEDKAKLILMLHGEVMQKLLLSDKFKSFLAMTFEITQKVDEENKSIGFDVREFTPEESMIAMRKAVEHAKQSESLIKVANDSDLESMKKPRFGKRRVR